jgi:hypothetical protein
MRRLLLTLAAAALVATISPSPAASAQSLAQQLEAARTAARVQTALVGDAQLRMFRLEAAVRGQAIHLVGTVETAAHRARAEEVARGVRGVGDVVNQIEVQAGARQAAGPVPPPLREAAPPGEIPPEAPTAPPTEAQAEAPARPPAQAPAEAAPRQQEAAAQYYTVRAGDNLGSIARRHNTTVAELQRLNNIRGTNIRAGQRLRVR